MGSDTLCLKKCLGKKTICKYRNIWFVDHLHHLVMNYIILNDLRGNNYASQIDSYNPGCLLKNNFIPEKFRSFHLFSPVLTFSDLI